MREVNADRLRDLAGYLRDAVRQPRELGAMPRDAFLAAPRTTNSVSPHRRRRGGADIGNHLAARRGGRSPADCAGCIAVLLEIGAISDDLRRRLVKMARFRNLTAHLYRRGRQRRGLPRHCRRPRGLRRVSRERGRYLGSELR